MNRLKEMEAENLQSLPKSEENHPYVNKIRSCYFYNYKGFCKFQENCNYLHEEKIRKECRYFLRDKCWFGRSCWYLHKIHSKELAAARPKPEERGNNGKCLEKNNTLLFREVKKLKWEIEQLKQFIMTLTGQVKNVFRKNDTKEDHKTDEPKNQLYQDQERSKKLSHQEASEQTSKKVTSIEKAIACGKIVKDTKKKEETREIQQESFDTKVNLIEHQQKQRKQQELMIQQHKQHMMMKREKKTKNIKKHQNKTSMRKAEKNNKKNVPLTITTNQTATSANFNTNITAIFKESQTITSNDNTTSTKDSNKKVDPQDRSQEESFDTEVNLLNHSKLPANGQKSNASFGENLRKFYCNK